MLKSKLKLATPSGTTLAEADPLDPPKLELQGRPMIRYSIVVEQLRPGHILLGRFVIFIPVGIAVIAVTGV